MASDDNNFPDGSEISQMSKVQKLAALLVILGPENAALVLKHFDAHELDSISMEMTKLTSISRELQQDVLREFSDVVVQVTTSIRGGVDFTQGVLNKAIGAARAAEIINRISPRGTPIASIKKITNLDARQLFNLLKAEQPRTIALILSYLEPEKGSKILGYLKDDQRAQVIERLATLAPAPIEVVGRIIETLTSKLDANSALAVNQTGGLKFSATLLNQLDKEASKALLISIEEKNPELGQAIRNKMFTFEDLIRLEQSAIQKVLREVDMRDLAVGLKTASEKLKALLLSCISRRAAETVKEEISMMGSIKLKEIEAAQLRIIEIVRRLETEGEIELGQTKEAPTDGIAA